MTNQLRLNMNAAIFLDRDGVLIEDVHLLTNREKIQILSYVPEALLLLNRAGYQIIVVSNQTVVSRGMATEDEVQLINDHMQNLLINAGAPLFDGIYFCPHHPNATLLSYRTVCECRKPEPGLLFQAAREHAIDLSASIMVGDRITDIIAGNRAGCRTVLVQTGKHNLPPIETNEPLDELVQPDYMCLDLLQAAKWVTKSL